MKLLAIETATIAVGCALWGDGAPVASTTLVAPQRHAEVLMPAIEEMCRRAGWSVEDLDGVAVDVGPGLFTGLRVGLATARAIAMARDIPAAAVQSLECLAYPHRRRPGPLVAVVDARRGEVYSAVFHSDGDGLTETRAARVTSPDQLAAELGAMGGEGGERALVIGDGAWRYRGALAATGAELGGPGEVAPSPLIVAELGAGRLVASSLPEPVYLRQADVRIGWEEVGGRGPGPAAGSPSAAPMLGR
jgi:tRNA threonylcarbamoyladenosine biosynthesis protein TsaB